MGKDEKLVLLDSDVIIHLFRAERLSLLQELYPDRIIILDVVYLELLQNPTINKQIENLLRFKQAKIYDFPTQNDEVMKEYIFLTQSQLKGKGESACMAVCRFDKNILASSNLRDIKPYCTQHNIQYLTTLDLLAIAFQRQVISEADADQCIKDIKANGSRLPHYSSISAFISKEFDKDKLKY